MIKGKWNQREWKLYRVKIALRLPAWMKFNASFSIHLNLLSILTHFYEDFIQLNKCGNKRPTSKQAA